MPKRFCITDPAGTDFGTLSYDEANKSWHIEINPQRTWDDTPLSLALFIKKGIYSLDEKQSLNWVRDRLVPPNRQNITQILASLGLEEYDEYPLLLHTKGTSPNDNLYLDYQG